MLASVFLGLGSNRDNRLWYLFQAIRLLDETPLIDLKECSSVYETEPYGVTNQRDFLNAVVRIETRFTPGRLLQCIKFIERKVGRKERGFWAAREIDIDILTFGKKVIRLPWLNIPHIELTKRRFVLEPLTEIAPDFQVPLWQKSVAALFEDCADTGRVKMVVPRLEFEEQVDAFISREEVLL